MKPAQPTPGTLYLVPTPLDFGCLPEGAHPAPITECLPIETVAVAESKLPSLTRKVKLSFATEPGAGT